MRACPEYRDLLTYVPGALEAIGKLGLGRYHQVVNLHRVLRTDVCATCGPFLFLPACQRCCVACKAYYPSLRLIRPYQARRYYGLSEEQCQELPTMHFAGYEILFTSGISFHTLYLLK